MTAKLWRPSWYWPTAASKEWYREHSYGQSEIEGSLGPVRVVKACLGTLWLRPQIRRDSGQILQMIIITLQALILKLTSLNRTCTSSKPIMQLTKTIFSDSAILIEKNTAGNQLCVGKKILFFITILISFEDVILLWFVPSMSIRSC